MLRGMVGTLSELFQMLWHRRRWWLIPLMGMLVLIGILLAVAGTAGIGPFIYTLF